MPFNCLTSKPYRVVWFTKRFEVCIVSSMILARFAFSSIPPFSLNVIPGTPKWQASASSWHSVCSLFALTMGYFESTSIYGDNFPTTRWFQSVNKTATSFYKTRDRFLLYEWLKFFFYQNYRESCRNEWRDPPVS